MVANVPSQQKAALLVGAGNKAELLVDNQKISVKKLVVCQMAAVTLEIGTGDRNGIRAVAFFFAF